VLGQNGQDMQTCYQRLNDTQWQVIKPFLNWQRKRTLDLRSIVDAILYVTRTGVQWRNLSETRFPAWTAVYYYYRKWKKEDIFDQINLGLNSLERLINLRAHSPSLALADSQSILLAPMIGEARGTDGHKKVNGRKRHILTDIRGRIYKVHVHAANQHDSPQGVYLLDNLKDHFDRLETIMTDSTYQGSFAKAVTGLGVKFEVPQRPEGTKGFVVEAKRWVVERSFAWLNFFRRTTKDYERTTESAEAFVILANISMVLWNIAG
jgi:transposase